MRPSVLLSIAALAVLVPAHPAAAATAPGPPTSVHAVQYASRQVKVSWHAPADNGGSPVTGYVITPYKAGVAQPSVAFGSVATTQVVEGLQNGKTYTFRVAALNAVGTGPKSAPTGGVRVGAPGRPRIRFVTVLGPGHLRLTLATPSAKVGKVQRFDARCTSKNGGVTGTGVRLPPLWPTVHVDDLTHGKTYRCTVTASNQYGTGARSEPSKPVEV